MIRPLCILTGLVLCGSVIAAADQNPRDWWSLRPLVRPVVPAAAGARTPVDAFIAAKLAEKGLTMSPEADKASLNGSPPDKTLSTSTPCLSSLL